MNDKTHRTIMVGLRPRPQRVAFLVNRKPSLNTLRKIAIYCSAVWGGLMSIIVESDKNSLLKEDWILLESFDPDLIYSFLPISDDFNIELNDKIMPIWIIADEPRFFSMKELYNAEITGIVNEITTSLEDDLDIVMQLMVSEEDECYDEALFNFGLYDFDSDNRLRELREDKAIQSIPVTSYSDLFAVDGSSFSNRIWTFFRDSSPLFITLRHAPYLRIPHRSKELKIFIYRTASHIIDFWNARALNLEHQDFSDFWLLLSEKCLRTSSKEYPGVIVKWINNKLTPITPYNPEPKITWFLPKKIKNIKNLISEINTDIEKEILNEIRYEYISNFSKRFSDSRSFIRREIQFNNNRATIENQIPVFFVRNYIIQKWILEIEIKEPITGHSPYDLPRFQQMSDLFLKENKYKQSYKFKNSCRFDRKGNLSCLINNSTTHIQLSLPFDYDIFRTIMENVKIPNAIGRGPAIEKSPEIKGYVSFNISDKGELGRGIENVFKTLEGAANFLNSKDWRDCFSQMAKGISSELEISTMNKIEKILVGHLSIPSVKTKLSHSIVEKTISALQLPARRSLSLSISELPFSFIYGVDNNLTELIRADFKQNRYKEAFRGIESLSERELNQDHGFFLSESLKPGFLIKLGVLQGGFNLKCYYCGSAYWYPIGELNEKFTCRGCLRIQSMPINPTWKYKLNDLVARGLANQGAIPPILTLARLKKSAKNSFFHLHEQYLSAKNTQVELDILCIVEGRLIVGECKESSKKFTEEEIDKISTIAGKLDADEIIFSSMDPTFNRGALRRIKALKKSLVNKRDVQIMMLTNRYRTSIKSRYIHVPKCPHYSKISRKNIIEYREWLQLQHERKPLCALCYKVSEKMKQIWRYWPYPYNPLDRGIRVIYEYKQL